MQNHRTFAPSTSAKEAGGPSLHALPWTQALVHSDTEASTLFLSMPFPRNQPFRTPGESCSRLAVELSSPPAPAPSQVLAL